MLDLKQYDAAETGAGAGRLLRCWTHKEANVMRAKAKGCNLCVVGHFCVADVAHGL